MAASRQRSFNDSELGSLHNHVALHYASPTPWTSEGIRESNLGTDIERSAVSAGEDRKATCDRKAGQLPFHTVRAHATDALATFVADKICHPTATIHRDNAATAVS